MGAFRDWGPLLRWSWLIPWCAILCLSASYLALTVAPSTYQATAILRVDLPLSAQIVSPPISPATVLNGIAQDATSAGSLALAVKQLPGMTPSQIAGAVDITIEPTAYLLDVGARADTPQQAALIANAVAQAVITHQTVVTKQEDAAGEQPLRAQIGATVNKITQLQAQLANLQSQGVAATSASLLAVQGELASQNSAYTKLVATLAQLQFYEGIQQPSLQLEQAAEAVTAAQQPDEKKLLAGSALGGAALGLLLAALVSRRRARITTATPVAIPGAESCPVWRLPYLVSGEPLIGSATGANSAGAVMQQILISLAVTSAVRPLKSVLVAGLHAGAGTSMTAVRLADSLAASGKRILLVDANLKHPTQHLRLGLGNTPGLSDAVLSAAAGRPTVEQYVVNTSMPSLKLLPAGKSAADEGSVLASSAMGLVLDELLAGSAEVVLLDAPPLLPHAGTVALAERVDGIILIADAARSTRYQLERALEQLDGSTAVLTGIIVVSPLKDGRRMHQQPGAVPTSPQYSPVATADVGKSFGSREDV